MQLAKVYDRLTVIRKLVRFTLAESGVKQEAINKRLRKHTCRIMTSAGKTGPMVQSNYLKDISQNL